MNLLGMHLELPGWLGFAAGPIAVFAANLIAWAVIALLARLVLRLSVRYVTRRSTTQLDDLIVSIVRRPLVLLIIAYGFLSSWELAYGESGITNALQRLYNGLLIVLGAYVAWRVLFQVLIEYLRPKVQESDSQADDILVPVLSRIGPVIIIVAVANAVVATLGGNLGTLLASLGLLGLVLGYLFQEPLQGLFSGTYMALDNPFREDDLLILEDGTTCQVRNVGVRVTQLYDIKRHVLLYMPNNRLAASKIVNLTKPSVELRSVLTVSFNKPCSCRDVAELLMDACNSHENILGDWRDKESSIRRRQDAYRQQYRRLQSGNGNDASASTHSAQLQVQLRRLDGELIRLQVEYSLRGFGERFSHTLLGLVQLASELQDGGFTPKERQRLKRRLERLMDQFDDLIEQITVWLYLVKIIESELTDESYSASIGVFVERDLLRDGKLTLRELKQCRAPGAPTRPMVRREDLRRIRKSDIEADKAIDRSQFRDRPAYVDYRRLYSIWHRNIVHVYRGLEQCHRLESIEHDWELHLDRRLRAIERHFSDTFILRVSYWQLPFASLVDATDTALKYELAFFVDDVVREQFQRSARVTTELLMEIDRRRTLMASTGAAAATPTA